MKSLYYQLISYLLISIVFLLMGMYFSIGWIETILFSITLISILFTSSFFLKRGHIDKKSMLAVKMLTYLLISSLVFIFVVSTTGNNDLLNKLLISCAGSITIISYLIAISHSGRERSEV